MPFLNNGQSVGNYTIQAFIKTGEYNETYKAGDANGVAFFVKLYDPRRVPDRVKTDDGTIREIAVLRSIDSPYLISYVADGTVDIDGTDYPYMVTKYFTGPLLADQLIRGVKIPLSDALAYYTDILRGLHDLHAKGYLHNDITPRNIMFDCDGGKCSARLIDFGHVAEPCDGVVPFPTSDLTPCFQANETFWNTYSVRTDIYGATSTFYAMLFGEAPWQVSLPSPDEADYKKKVRQILNEERSKSLDINADVVAGNKWVVELINHGLAKKAEHRAHSVDELLQTIESKGEFSDHIEPQMPEKKQQKKEQKAPKETPQSSMSEEKEEYQVPDGVKAHGNGFADVAGLDSLKNMLQQKVIFLLKNKQLAERYKLTPPNGMLLYGPPGCGKTYFAEKFAEESGFNFHFVKASDLGSIYIHGSQGKIAELFKKAEKDAPSIICFDEFDAMVPKRDNVGQLSPSAAGEVNEFLSQLNNCSKRGLFIIGTTNKPHLIDEAALRKGRLDLQFFMPAPDEQTRKLMFELYLKDRPCADINAEELARMTDNYVASDIAYIVNDAAMIAAFADEPITQDKIVTTIKATRPSLTADSLRYYNDMQKRFEGGSEPTRRHIGFTVTKE